MSSTSQPSSFEYPTQSWRERERGEGGGGGGGGGREGGREEEGERGMLAREVSEWMMMRKQRVMLVRHGVAKGNLHC